MSLSRLLKLATPLAMIFVQPAFAALGDQLEITAERTPLRSWPRLTADNVRLLDKQEAVVELSRNNGWVEIMVRSTGNVGWVPEAAVVMPGAIPELPSAQLKANQSAGTTAQGVVSQVRPVRMLNRPSVAVPRPAASVSADGAVAVIAQQPTPPAPLSPPFAGAPSEPLSVQPRVVPHGRGRPVLPDVTPPPLVAGSGNQPVSVPVPLPLPSATTQPSSSYTEAVVQQWGPEHAVLATPNQPLPEIEPAEPVKAWDLRQPLQQGASLTVAAAPLRRVGEMPPPSAVQPSLPRPLPIVPDFGDHQALYVRSEAGVALRVSANDDAEAVAQLPQSLMVLKMRRRGGWLRVRLPENSLTGWVRRGDVGTEPPPATTGTKAQ